MLGGERVGWRQGKTHKASTTEYLMVHFTRFAEPFSRFSRFLVLYVYE